ncbi:MAG: Alpha,2-fucosyltransferase, partial [Ilumatobacteraceae bacterium]|nr:Alpha,2-fucosyltransferase [Ilumatobacteraceae bacterium]
NSSFSWWGAYLNPQAEVYAPSRWFGPEMPAPNDRQDDIVPPSWRQVPVYWGD